MTRPVLRELMQAVGRALPEEDELEFVSGDSIYDTRLALGRAAADIAAAVGVLAADLWRMRSGESQRVRVDERRAAAGLSSYAFLRGEAVVKPFKEFAARYGGGVNLAAFFATLDERWIHLHGGFPKLREGAIELLGCEDSAQAVGAAVASWNAFQLEDALAEVGMCGVVARTKEEWASHPQGRALARLPVVEVTKIAHSAPEPLSRGERPLSGVRCLDLTRVLAGPTCARTLAEHGAEVLRISARHVPHIGLFLLDTAHGKRSAWLDLRDTSQRETLKQLVRDGDVFSQGYRLDVMRRFGLSPQELAELRPGIVYTSINCFGHEGPWRDRPGWEQLAQTASGMAIEHGGSQPALVPAAATDYGTGYLAALGTMAALRRRATEGGSYHVRVSLCQTAMLYLRQPRVAAAARGLDDDERRSFCIESDAPDGELTHLAPVVTMSKTAPHWDHGPVETGTHPAAWSGGG